jgi:hypothetical protein
VKKLLPIIGIIAAGSILITAFFTDEVIKLELKKINLYNLSPLFILLWFLIFGFAVYFVNYINTHSLKNLKLWQWVVLYIFGYGYIAFSAATDWHFSFKQIIVYLIILTTSSTIITHIIKNKTS